MNPSEYQKLAARTECDQGKSQHRIAHGGLTPTRLLHAVVGLTGDAGELAGSIERWLYYGQSLDRVNVVEEIGDCLWYLALACNALELDLGDVMESNIRKLRRRYPERYSDVAAAEENRDREAERKALADRDIA